VRRLLPILPLLLSLLACATAREAPPAAPGPSGGAPAGGSAFEEEGLASWYGAQYHGQRTSSGEVFDMNAMTAAHRTLPFGTRVEVTCPSTARSVEVRINDRGPFVPGRIIDLSHAAAKELGIAVKGVDRVRIRTVGRVEGPAPRPSAQAEADPKRLVIQVGAFKNHDNARNLKARLEADFAAVTLQPYGEFLRVLIGPLENEAEAARALEKADGLGLPGIIRPL
jgi:rare lipoprotein A